MNDACVWYFLLCIRAQVCAVPQSHTEKKKFTWFCTANSFSGFQELQKRFSGLFSGVCGTRVPRASVCHVTWVSDTAEVLPRAQSSSWDCPSPRSRVMQTLPAPRCAVAARCWVAIGRGLVPGVAAALPSQPEGRALPGSPLALSIVSNWMASAGTADRSFTVWSSESPPRPHFY